MKITDFKTFIVGNPPPSFGGKYWIFLKLTTDTGIVGFGEAICNSISSNSSSQMMRCLVNVCLR